MNWLTRLMRSITSFLVLIFIVVEGLVTPVFAAGNPINISTQSGVSRNWAGYSAIGGSFTSVSGTWVIPTAPDNDQGVDATWIGIGGVSSHDLIQAGTQRVGSGVGGSIYEAFFELLPRASRPLDIAVKGGDSITVDIVQQQSGQWLISFKDNSTGQSVQTKVSYDSSLSSAEWIMEAPSTGRRILPLDNFGTVQFTEASATKDGQNVNLLQLGASSITMVDNRDHILATPNSVESDGKSFSVTRTSQTESDIGSFVPMFMFRSGFHHLHYPHWTN